MRCDIYKDQFQSAELFGKPVLYTRKQIQRETVPDGWHCYDLSGTDRNPDRPSTLEDKSVWDRIGTVLSPAPLKRETTLARQIRNNFSLHEELLDLAVFCAKHQLDYPADPRKFILRPASHREAGLFYSQMEPEHDAKEATIGHLRIDFGGGGFHHSWWPHNDDRFNTPVFKAALQEFVDELRVRGPLQSNAAMRRWCCGYPEGEIQRDHTGFVAETADYRFCLRCSARGDDYSYLYCYDLKQQRLTMEEKPSGLAEAGRQRLREAADPASPHSYDWYVPEAFGTPEEQFASGLSLEEAIQRYTASENSSKRLGVTKDGIAAVDLTIHWDGREWLSEDRLRMEEFRDDPVMADAAARLRQVLDESPAAGRVTFASGERWNYTDPGKYLQAVREELPLQAATGFRCETLTDDPEVRKAVDDMLCDLYGEENPRTLEDYGNTGMTMGGIT